MFPPINGPFAVFFGADSKSEIKAKRSGPWSLLPHRRSGGPILLHPAIGVIPAGIAGPVQRYSPVGVESEMETGCEEVWPSVVSQIWMRRGLAFCRSMQGRVRSSSRTAPRTGTDAGMSVGRLAAIHWTRSVTSASSASWDMHPGRIVNPPAGFLPLNPPAAGVPAVCAAGRPAERWPVQDADARLPHRGQDGSRTTSSRHPCSPDGSRA